MKSSSPVLVLRLVVLGTLVTSVVPFFVLWLVGLGFTQAGALWLALPVLLGAAALVLVPAVGSTVRPLPHGVSDEQRQRITMNVLRTVTVLRLALSEAAALFGLVASLISGSLIPYALGLLFAIPLMLLLVYPGDRVIETIKSRIESGGVSSRP